MSSKLIPGSCENWALVSECARARLFSCLLARLLGLKKGSENREAICTGGVCVCAAIHVPAGTHVPWRWDELALSWHQLRRACLQSPEYILLFSSSFSCVQQASPSAAQQSLDFQDYITNCCKMRRLKELVNQEKEGCKIYLTAPAAGKLMSTEHLRVSLHVCQRLVGSWLPYLTKSCGAWEFFNFFPFFAERGILTSPEAASAMSKVDRKLFVPPTALPYKDSPQVIGKV